MRGIFRLTQPDGSQTDIFEDHLLPVLPNLGEHVAFDGKTYYKVIAVAHDIINEFVIISLEA